MSGCFLIVEAAGAWVFGGLRSQLMIRPFGGMDWFDHPWHSNPLTSHLLITGVQTLGAFASTWDRPARRLAGDWSSQGNQWHELASEW